MIGAFLNCVIYRHRFNSLNSNSSLQLVAIVDSMKMKKIYLESLQEKACLLTREELKKYIIPDGLTEKMRLFTIIEGDDSVFALYIPGKRSKDAVEISRTRMNIYTGEGIVEYIGLERKKDS